MNDWKSALFFPCSLASRKKKKRVGGGVYQLLLSARAVTSSSSHTESLFSMDLVCVAMRVAAFRKAHLEKKHCRSF